jgi:hypothetical protein
MNHYDIEWFQTGSLQFTINTKLSSIEKKNNEFSKDYCWCFLNTNIWLPLIIWRPTIDDPNIQRVTVYNKMQAQRNWYERDVWELKLKLYNVTTPDILYGIKVDDQPDMFIVQRTEPAFGTIQSLFLEL